MLDFMLHGMARYNITPAVRMFQGIDTYRRVYHDEFEKIEEYYRISGRASLNSNILTRIVTNLVTDVTYDRYQYYAGLMNNIPYACRNMGVVSSSNTGKVHQNNNIFYTHTPLSGSVYEILISMEKNRFNISYDAEQVMATNAIRPIYTDDDDIGFYTPVFPKQMIRDSLFVYEVDLQVIGLQYYIWANDQIANDRDIHPTNFVMQILLPKMSRNIFDMNMLTRLFNISTQTKPTPFRRYYPFALHDYTMKIDVMLNEVLDVIRDARLRTPEVLYNIPLISDSNAFEILKLGNTYFNVQNSWAYWLARVFVIEYLLTIGGNNAIEVNTNILQQLPYDIRALRNRSTNLAIQTPLSLLERFNKSITNISNMLAKNKLY